MNEIGLGLTTLSGLIWLGLLSLRGQFWQTTPQLETASTALWQEEANEAGTAWPKICAVIPARNEAELLPITLRSLLTQTYPGSLTVVLVDDHSTDGTAQVARETAESVGKLAQLQVISAETLPAGWTGKLWAMEQGIQKAAAFTPDYILLTDADIAQGELNLQRLVNHAMQQELDLASVMVRLRCESFWEKLLIPAFVFFFQKLYPFQWVNDPQNPTAAAAGGCILIRQTALDRIGGISAIRQALIDDCALANAVKSSRRNDAEGRIWLGLSDRTCSLRPYPSLKTIWDMVARTAFTQLNYSPFLLLGTLLGMTLVYLIAPVSLVIGVLTGAWAIAISGFIGWLLMTIAYFPIIRFYRCAPWFALCLPGIAFLYTLMTLDSAIRHWQGRGGAWKGRVYEIPKRAL